MRQSQQRPQPVPAGFSGTGMAFSTCPKLRQEAREPCISPGLDVGDPQEGDKTKRTSWGDIQLQDSSKQCSQHLGSRCLLPERRSGGHIKASTTAHPLYHWTHWSGSSRGSVRLFSWGRGSQEHKSLTRLVWLLCCPWYRPLCHHLPLLT